MTFKELISKHGWYEVERTLFDLYPDEKDENLIGYVKAFNELMRTEPVESDMTIHIDHVDEEDCAYENVHAFKEGDTESYGLDFVSWAEVLGMPIAEQSLETYGELPAISHILFEITFHGYTSAAVVGKGERLRETASAELRELGVGL